MARLQILELPEGSGDDRPPFVLVVDESVPQRYILGPDDNPYRDYWQDIAATIGARGVIVTPDTVDIPANDTTAYLDTAANGALPPDAHYEMVIDDKPVTWTRADEAHARTVDAVQERTDIARDMDRLAKWKTELADALGMDHTRDWDDIRNAAAGLRQERDAQAAEIARLRAGEEPTADKGVVPTPAQWIWHWNQATPEKRLSMAAQIQDGMTRSNNCFMADHETQITRLRAEIDRLIAESAGVTNPDA